MPAINLILRKYPKLVEALKNRHIDYNNSTDYIFQKEKNGELMVICPKEKIPVGKVEHDPNKLKIAYEMGRETAIEMIGDIKEYLK